MNPDFENSYFDWMYDMMCSNMSSRISYRKLFMLLHSTEFRWIIDKDENRASDGLSVRRKFYLRTGIEVGDIGPCSVLEMMIGLAVRCEETIMDDTRYGDRTSQWFWEMISNIGLNGLTDSNWNKREAIDKIDILLDRNYEPDGTGGLFTIKDSIDDLRYVEIWCQLNWYLSSIL